MFLSSLIKYPYLPIMAAAGSFVVWQAWRSKLVSRAGLQSLCTGFRALSRLKMVLLVAVLLVSFGLFTERYVGNIITYHDPVPACDAVISEDQCSQYGPYHRDHGLALSKPASFHPNIFVYLWEWLYGMWYRLFFAINYNYANNPPLLIISYAGVLVAALMAVGTTLRFRWLLRDKPLRQAVFWITAVYVLVLFADGVSSYARTAQPVAINGRYLIPFLPFMFAFGGMAWGQLLRKWPVSKPAIVSVILAIFLLQGGGTMTFIVRSQDSWMWNNGAVRSVNRAVRTVASPVIFGKNLP
jgi:hypothetical protein